MCWQDSSGFAFKTAQIGLFLVKLHADHQCVAVCSVGNLSTLDPALGGAERWCEEKEEKGQ
jgi:hypothetical protein